MNKDENFLLNLISEYDFNYVVLETKYTMHHIERLMPTCKDRGCIKWIGESKPIIYEDIENDEEARKSHIDRSDMFPRLFFFKEYFVKEISEWLKIRGLKIIDIRKGEF